jgi:hypothetical protein
MTVRRGVAALCAPDDSPNRRAVSMAAGGEVSV